MAPEDSGDGIFSLRIFLSVLTGRVFRAPQASRLTGGLVARRDGQKGASKRRSLVTGGSGSLTALAR